MCVLLLRSDAAMSECKAFPGD